MEDINDLDIVALLYSLKKNELETHIRKENVIWVTDLVRCDLKREYENKFPEIALKDFFNPVFILGDLIHKGLETTLRSVFGDRIEIEVEGEKNITLPDGRSVVIKGRSDAILRVDGKRIGIEIKSSRSDLGIPLDHHIDQVKIYNWMFDLDKTILIYITGERITQFTVEARMSEDEIVSRILHKNYPRYSWECGYCAFSIICPFKKHK